MEARTTRCSVHEHPEFIAIYDEQVTSESFLRPFLTGLENTVSDGHRYNSGETIQFGWMILSLEATPQGELLLLEPDMQSFPIKFVPSVDRTLHHIRIQRYTAESVGLEEHVSFPSILQSAIVCSQPGKLGFFLERDIPEGHGSGWFVGCNEPEHEHNKPETLSFLSLYEISCRFPFLIDFFALPPKSAISIDAEANIALYFDAKPLRASPESYLEAKYGMIAAQ
jgi:hypothetical protein